MNQKALKYSSYFVILVISFFVFYYATCIESWQAYGRHTVSDVSAHVNQVIYSNKIGVFPAYSIWFWLIGVASGFSLHFDKVAFILITFTSILVSIKYLVNYAILEDDLKNHSANKGLVALTSFLLIFAMPIVTYYKAVDHPNQMIISNFHFYLGNLISPNQWHNSTSIFAMPINILWFFYSIKNMNMNKLQPFFVMSLLGLVSILCKPSFAIVFFPVFCGALFLSHIKHKNYQQMFTKFLILMLFPTAILAYQYHFTFITKAGLAAFPASSKIIISPFFVWKLYSPNLLISILASLAFPISILFFYHNRIDTYVRMAWLTFAIALTMFIFFAEYPNSAAANYAWGCIAANYTLFLFSARFLLNQPRDLRAKITFSVLCLHFLSGCFLLISFFVRQSTLLM